MAFGEVLSRFRSSAPKQIGFWFVALCIGVLSGYAAVGFRLAIAELQMIFYGADDVALASTLAALPWYWVLAIPVAGGITVGLILNRFTPDGRVQSVANVIEGAALREGRVDTRAGFASILASLITLSTGGSTGREGPVVHMGAVISSVIANRMRANGLTGRDLMGCAVAAAVAASFNAPIAGALFALEVVLRHFALHAMAPISVAAVAGAVVSRLHLGDFPEFLLPLRELAFYVELPAFLLLGIVCGLVAGIMSRSVLFAEAVGTRIQHRLRIPGWLRPGISGFILGMLALWFPHIIGVGYETTRSALIGSFDFQDAVILAMFKVLAVAITFGGRMGGGIFSPSLMVGALTGLAFGHVATGLLPGVSGTETLYALAGTGAVAAGVLGAPISTTMIIFELTGEWQAGVAVMVSVSLSSAIASQMMDRSFFLSQLARKKKSLAGGSEAYIASTIPVMRLAQPLGDGEEMAAALAGRGARVSARETLETALPLFANGGEPVLAVTNDGRPVGFLHECDALRAYSRALVRVAQEEHS